jgi:predicted nucleic-acid-binding protein
VIAVDTNVIVRLLTRDEEEQFQRAAVLISKHDIFIPETVILETEWVLRYAYKFEIPAICDALTKTLGLPNVKIERPSVIAQDITLTRQGLDFADALHLASCNECTRFFTFDATFVKRAKGLTNCKVCKP